MACICGPLQESIVSYTSVSISYMLELVWLWRGSMQLYTENVVGHAQVQINLGGTRIGAE